MKFLIVGLACSLLVAGSSEALLVASDSFANTQGGADYNIGDLRGQSATVGTTGYTGSWTSGTAAHQIVAGGLNHAMLTGTALDGQLVAYIGTGGAERKLFRQINYTPTDGTYYLSVLFLKDEANTNREMLAGLGPSEGSNSGYATSQATYMGIYNGGFAFTPGGNSFTQLLTPTELTVGETFLGLMEVNYSSTGSDSVTVKVYNASSSLVANQTFTGLDLDGDISHFAVGTRDYAPYVGIDEMRFGTELGDVIVPEPGSLALIGLGGLLIARRRRSSECA